MPLHILLILVVGGIGGIVILLRLLGFSKPKTYSTPQDAQTAWHREFPEIEPQDVHLCAAQTAALVQTCQGTGILFAMGADSAARLLDGATLDWSETALSIHIPDFTAPRITVPLTQTEIAAWRAVLTPKAAQ